MPEIGGKGLFTEELEQALRDGRIDVAVHSVKDLPTDLAEGLALLAVPVREDPRDAWVAAGGVLLDDLPSGSLVGTGSLRRQAQLLMRRPDLRFVGLRGNVDTRIHKVHRGDCAAAVLAMAGLRRSGLTEHVTVPLEPEWMLPAPGQGALGLEGRAGDERVKRLLEPLHDDPTALAISCERAVLGALDAGCRAPVAVLAVCRDRVLTCRALVVDPKGQTPVTARTQTPDSEVDEAVHRLVESLRAAGAAEIVAACREGGLGTA